MTKTLLNVAFLISAAELDPASPRFYQHTVKCYHDLFATAWTDGVTFSVATTQSSMCSVRENPLQC